MTTPDLINTTGVSLILLAFLLLQLKRVSATNTAYLLMNAVGAGLAAYGSFLIKAWPFVVLEGVWALVAVISLVNAARTAKTR
jgi:hypothetical protein